MVTPAPPASATAATARAGPGGTGTWRIGVPPASTMSAPWKQAKMTGSTPSADVARRADCNGRPVTTTNRAPAAMSSLRASPAPGTGTA